MATEPLEELWSLWQREKLPPEQAIGQILQHLMVLTKEIEQLKRRPGKLPPDKKA